MVQYEVLLRPLSAWRRRRHQSAIGRANAKCFNPSSWFVHTNVQKMRWISLHWTFLHGSTDFALTGKLEEHHPSLIWESRQSARNNPANRNPLQCRLGRSCRKARQVNLFALGLFTREPRSRLRGITSKHPKPRRSHANILHSKEEGLINAEA